MRKILKLKRKSVIYLDSVHVRTVGVCSLLVYFPVSLDRQVMVTSQSLQINRYGLVVTHPAVVLYKR
jgi:hypothetical protein